MLSIRRIGLACLIFLLGYLASTFFPFSTPQNPSEAPVPESGWLSVVSAQGSAQEHPSPYNWINQSSIHVSESSVRIDIKNPEWATFTDTNSMDPVIDAESHAIQIVPTSEDMVHVGDIISYQSEYAEGIIIHRVIETGRDEEGWYATVRGDNLRSNDPGKVRFSQVRRILVAIIY